MSTFTANYNVTGSDRKELVNLVAETIGSPAKYQGAPSFAYMVDYITIDRNGVLSFDDRADTEIIENLLEQLTAHGFNAEIHETAPDSPNTEKTNEAEEVPITFRRTKPTSTCSVSLFRARAVLSKRLSVLKTSQSKRTATSSCSLGSPT